MSVTNPTSPSPTTSRSWSPSELRRLAPAEREAILAKAAELAAADYANDPSLTEFEAFGKNDLYGSSSDTEPR
jgi:hypothetical protein